MTLRRSHLRQPFLRRAAFHLIVLTLSLCPMAALHAQAPAETPLDQLRTLSRDELEVVKVLTRQEDSWNKGNLDAFATGYKNSPDILFIGRQVSHGYEQMLADYKKNYPNKETMGALSFSALEPHVLDEHYAVVVGHYKLERSRKNGGNAEGIFSLIFEKTADGWKIIIDHTT